MSEKLVSIIIPIYNVGNYIEECLLSVFNQSYSNIELIIIDDKGNDDSMSIVNKILDKCRFRYKIIDQKINKGVSEARNTGIKNASGYYIFFLDGDDVLTRDCISFLVYILESNNSDIAIANFKSIHEFDFKNIGNIDKEFVMKRNFNDCKDFSEEEDYDFIWNCLYKREFIIVNKLFFDKELYFAEDAFWMLQARFIATKLTKSSQITYFYRVNENSSSVRIKNSTKYINGLILVIKKLSKLIHNINYDNKEKGIIVKKIRSYKNGIYATMVENNIKNTEILYEELRKVSFYYRDLVYLDLDTKFKVMEFCFALIPFLDSYPVYKRIMSIKLLKGGLKK